METGLIIFARMSSSRLPGKMLTPIAGRPLLGRVIDRARRVEGSLPIVVATSTKDDDDVIERFARDEGVDVFRGSLDDVAGRALACCEAIGFERFARICGDRPFLPWELIGKLIAMAEQADLDLASNVVEKTFPAGTATEIVAARALRRVVQATAEREDREHLTRYIYAHPGDFTIGSYTSDRRDWAHLNLAVDDRADVERAVWMIDRLGTRPECAPLAQVAALAETWNAEMAARTT